MPIISSKYKISRIFRNGHVQTILPYIIRKKPLLRPIKKKLQTHDGDELSYFHFNIGSKNLVVITHGLEGQGDDKYILHMAKILNYAGFDVLSWNMRGCGGETNKTEKFYNGLDYEDLDFIINSFEEKYSEINLIGISLGGSITGNYVSRNAEFLLPKIKKATLLSTPLDLESSRLSLENNVSKVLYQRVFLQSMKDKVQEKVQKFNINVDLKRVLKAKYISEIDHLVIAPLYGYESGKDYRQKASCLPHLGKTKIPILIINALDDPFLGIESYPYDLAKKNELLFLETPKHGGHIGFIKSFGEKFYYHEKVILNWLT